MLVPDWPRIAALTERKRAIARDAKSVILGFVRDERQPNPAERRQLEQLHRARR